MIKNSDPKFTEAQIVLTNKHLNIETGPIITLELSKATNSIQNGKAVGLDEIPTEVWKIDVFQEFLLESCNFVYNQSINNETLFRNHTYTNCC